MPLFEVTYPVHHRDQDQDQELMVKGMVALPPGLTSSFETWSNSDVHVTPADSLLDAKPIESQQKLPALLYCRGGIGHVGKVKREWIRRFASHGFVVIAPYYRGSQSGAGRDEFGGRDVFDVVHAYHLLTKLPFVDASRISIMGFSRGSINATSASTHVSPYRLVLWGGVADLAATYDDRVDLRRMLRRVIGGTPARVPGAYALRSPVQCIDRIMCPVLLMHGERDEQVLVRHSDVMYSNLVSAGKIVTYFRYFGLGHHLPSPIHEAVIDRMMEYLK